MNKILVALLCGVFLFSFNFVSAQQGQEQQGIHESGTGLTDPDLKDAGQGTGQGLQDEDQTTSSDSGQGEQGQENGNQSSGESQSDNDEPTLRRSRVSNAVQSMLEVAERNEGISQQIRNITQNQIQTQEEAEGALEMAQQRKGFVKFLIGPDYGELKKVEERLNQHNQNLEELKALEEDIDPEDATLFNEQIQAMEEVKQEMEDELGESRSGLSLFGWLNKIFNS